MHTFTGNTQSARDGLDGLLFWLLVGVHQLPIWLFAFVPTVDGPAHLYSAEALRHFLAQDSSIFREYLTLNPNPDPTWFTALVLAGGMSLVPSELLLKVVVAGYALLLPLAGRYVIRGVSADADYLALLVFPFIYGYTFHVGMLSFSYAVAVGFFMLGFWVRRRDNPGWRALLILGLLALLSYLLHVVVFGLIVLAIALLAVTHVLISWSRQAVGAGWHWAELWRQVYRHGFRVALVLLPALVLALVFLLSRSTYTFEENPPFIRLQHLGALTSLVSFRFEEVFFSAGLSLFCCLLAGVALLRRLRQRRLEFWDALLLLAGIYTLIYLLLPETMLISENGMLGGSFLQKRIQPYPLYALLLWLAAQRWRPAVAMVIRGAAVILAAGLLTLHSLSYHAMNVDFAEYMSVAPHIQPNSVLLPLHLQKAGSGPRGEPVSAYIDPYWHLSSYLAMRRDLLTLDDFQASMGYFPLMFRDGYFPYGEPRPIPGGALVGVGPPNPDVLARIKRLDLMPDYVLVWLGRASGIADAPAVYTWLDRHYQRIYISSPQAYAELYRRLPDAS